MRRFTPEYLAHARDGLWAGDRSALAPLRLADQGRILDAGAGTGAFTRVLREEAGPGATVYAADADPSLLAALPDGADRAAGAGGPDGEQTPLDAVPLAADATRLPIRDRAVDVVACQALLVNLPDPAAAVAEFARVAADRVAVVEPDNAAVSVSSSVGTEPALARRLRRAYRAGADTDLALGDASELFADAGLVDVEHRVVHHTRVTEPPYDDADLEAARRKAAGTRIDATRRTLLAGDIDAEKLAALAADWRSMGRTVVDQMADERYRRAEVVPYHVTVGRVP